MFYAFTAAVVGINVYCWWKLRSAFLRSSPLAAGLLLLLILLALFTPAWSRLVFHDAVPRFITQAGWIWLAWSFWLVTAFLPCDLWNCALRIAALLRSDLAPCMARLCLPPRACAAAALSFTAFATIWGMFEAASVKVRTVDIRSEKVPQDVQYRICLISDLHIGPAISDARFQKTLKLLEECGCDLLLSAGDLIDGHSSREAEMASQLARLSPPDGKLAVFGNHDVYSSKEFSRECHEKAGFAILENQQATPRPWLLVYGEKDPAAGWHPGFKSGDAPAAFPELVEDRFSILLKHRPDFDASSPFSLQLSGHSHGGQIFPFSLLVRLQHSYSESRLHVSENGSKLYVSMGTGVWGPPFRFLARPEITIFNIKSESVR